MPGSIGVDVACEILFLDFDTKLSANFLASASVLNVRVGSPAIFTSYVPRSFRLIIGVASDFAFVLLKLSKNFLASASVLNVRVGCPETFTS